MKITIDEERCIGCGTCESLCSQCFKMENGVAKVVKKECDDCDVKEVAENCPVQAINIEE